MISRGAGVSSVRDHLPSILILAVFSVVWTFPLIRYTATHIPGEAAGDNVTFVWNFWWMRTALAGPGDFWWTPYLFAPVGTSLVLHTHTALSALVGATLLGSLTPLEAQNVVLLAHVFLNAAGAYLLAWQLTRHRASALTAAMLFAGSPFFAAHLRGHFNLIGAWGLPFFAAFWLRTLESRSNKAAVAAGLCLAALAFQDYYYVVYAVSFAVLSLWLRRSGFAGVSLTRARHRPWLSRIILLLLAIDACAIAAIARTGGFTTSVFGSAISMRSLVNPLAFGWLLLAAWLLTRWRIRVDTDATAVAATSMRVVALTTIVAVVAMLPLLWRGVALWISGGYVSQAYFWRSAPHGVDAATLVLGNPYHPLWGGAIQQWYLSLGINPIESAGPLGLVPLVTIALGRRAFTQIEARRWLTIAAFFLVWALGPFLTLLGTDIWLVLPQTLLRFVPIVSNARIPGRALVMVYLALAMLVAFTLAEIHRRGARWPAWIVAVLIVCEYGAGGLPLFQPDPLPSIYYSVESGGPSDRDAVLELPVGIRDGFGEEGHLDHRVLLYQTEHGRPLVGGFVARLSPDVRQAYAQSPVLHTLLRLSSDRTTETDEDVQPVTIDRAGAGRELRRLSIRFVVLDRSTARPALIRFVESTLPLELRQANDTRELYEVIE